MENQKIIPSHMFDIYWITMDEPNSLRDFEKRLEKINAFDGNLVFGAKKFHQETNRTGQGKPSSGGMVREHLKIVKDTGSNRFQRIGNFWEDVNRCPACKSEEIVFFLERLGLEFWRCAACDHGFQNPRVSEEMAIKLYSDDKTASDIYTVDAQKQIDRIKYQYGIDVLRLFSGSQGRKIMDIGCGAGVFLEVAAENGWTSCVGVDANQRYASAYEETESLQYIQSNFHDLDESRLGSNYDAISMWNVLEHIYDLHSTLERIRALLSPGGLFLVMVPNARSLATRIIREESPTFNWKHVSHFTPKSLVKLVELHGFQTAHLETVISEIDNVKSYLSGEFPYHGHGDPDGLFDFITPRYIHENLLGSRILGIFRNV